MRQKVVATGPQQGEGDGVKMGNRQEQRARFSTEVAALGGIRSPSVLRAFATVPRERFLPPGPWMIETISGVYYATEDDDVSHVLHAVGVALDANRRLNNANPAKIGRTLEMADFRPGNTVLHVGAGFGYFSAIMAELVGRDGHVIAAEIEKDFALSARSNLAPWPNVEVVGDALTCLLPPIDVVFVSAGTSSVPRHWIDALRPGGRMILPLTGSLDGGFLFVIEKAAGATWLKARPREFIYFYPCLGAHGPEAATAVDAAIADSRGPSVKSLRLDTHEREPECWLHGHGWCLTLADKACTA